MSYFSFISFTRFPTITSSRLAGSIPVSSIIFFTTLAPNSPGFKGNKVPKKLPIADLFAATT